MEMPPTYANMSITFPHAAYRPMLDIFVCFVNTRKID